MNKQKMLVESDTVAEPSVERSPQPHGLTLTDLVAKVRQLRLAARVGKIGLFVFSLFIFILAIILMKDGARGLAPLVRDNLHVDNPINSLGFGWLFAYVVMSGSPVAASALTFFDVGVIDKLGTFTMITGSRLGASFIVLFIGFIYVLRGHARSSLAMGLLSLTVTFTTYVVGLFVGLGLLYSGRLDNIRFGASQINSAVDLLFDPIAQLFTGNLPGWLLFPIGLGIIMTSFNLFDRCLPEMSLKESQVGQMARLVYRPWVMFALGAAITSISMSVSVSLGILVPLNQRGYIRRENVIPYIMGANITTFIDTLLATLLLENPAAFTVVLVEMLSVTIVSVIILAACYHWYERTTLTFVAWVTAHNRNLAFFMISIFVVPILLMLW